MPPTFPPIPVPIPPGPILGPGDTIPTDFNGIGICQRPLTEENFADKCLNLCGTGHKFLAGFENGQPTVGYGFYPNGRVNSETLKILKCTRGKTCKPTNKPLKYGWGAETAGDAASKEQILDCIKNHPPEGSHNPPWHDCRHWAAKAATDCGLDCGQ